MSNEKLELEKELCDLAVSHLKQVMASPVCWSAFEDNIVDPLTEEPHYFEESEIKQINFVTVRWEESDLKNEEYTVRVVADIEHRETWVNHFGEEDEPDLNIEKQYRYVKILRDVQSGELFSDSSECRSQ